MTRAWRLLVPTCLLCLTSCAVIGEQARDAVGDAVRDTARREAGRAAATGGAVIGRAAGTVAGDAAATRAAAIATTAVRTWQTAAPTLQSRLEDVGGTAGAMVRTESAALRATAEAAVRTEVPHLRGTAAAVAATEVPHLRATLGAVAQTAGPPVDSLAESGRRALGTAVIARWPDILPQGRAFPNLAAGDDYVVGAYFDSGWGPGRERWRDGYRRLPELGEYDSLDADVARRQIDWATGHGIDFLAVGWRGQAGREDVVLQNVLLTNPLATDVRFAIHYETAERLRVYADRIDLSDAANRRTLLDDLRYLQETYWSGPRYLRIGARPVVFLNVARWFEGEAPGALAEVRRQARAAGHDPFLIADEVYWDPPDATAVARLSAYDAVTAYTMYAPVGGIANGFTERVKGRYAAWRDVARQAGIRFVPDVLPGYDDRAVRPHAGHPPIPHGVDLWRAQLAMALPLVDDQLGMLMITSWNEWGEDTAIEPARDGDLAYLRVLAEALRGP